MALSFKDRLLLEHKDGVMLCRSETEDGRAFFHYVLAARDQIERMQRDHEAGTLSDFASYGSILYSGWGKDPTPQEDAYVKELASSLK